MRRRRPVLRTAAIAGGGAALYHAGKKGQANADHEAAQDAAIEDTAVQQRATPPPAAPPPAAGGMAPGAIDELKQLGQLHEQGVLTDEEFAAQKAKILGG
ncbi:MAG: SHOCT domain-containing protein [Actinomycetota bacterium]